MLALQRASVPSRPMIAAGDDGGEGTGGERVGETAWAARQDGDGAGSSAQLTVAPQLTEAMKR